MCLKPGDRVRFTPRPAVHFDEEGVVVHVGDCGFPRCQHGDECVTVRTNYRGRSTTINPGPDRVEKIDVA